MRRQPLIPASDTCTHFLLQRLGVLMRAMWTRGVGRSGRMKRLPDSRPSHGECLFFSQRRLEMWDEGEGWREEVMGGQTGPMLWDDRTKMCEQFQLSKWNL